MMEVNDKYCLETKYGDNEMKVISATKQASE
jgi:hypothetical protein